MAHYKLILAYDGSEFAGFQRQAQKPTVQLALEDALRELGWQGRSIIAAGRTDTGVHGLGQVVSFDLNWRHGDEILLRALNAHLPKSIVGQAIAQVPPSFHPRYDALARHYRYQLYSQPQRNPLRERFAWRVWPKPDLALMNEAAQALLGEHDFRAFGKALKEDGTTTRHIFKANWQQVEDDSSFEISGNAFLYHMVRRIVHTLVQVGLGKDPVEIVERGLETGDIGSVRLAPAHGLTFVGVDYK